MPSVSKGEITELLKQDEVLINNWQSFYHHLDLHDNNIPAITQIYSQSGYSSFTLVSKIIGQWVAEKGSAATVAALADALKATNLNNISDILRKTFAPLWKIESVKYNLNAGTAAWKTHPNTTKEEQLLQKNVHLQTQTSGGVTILKVVKQKRDGKRGILISINYFLSILSQVGDRPVAIISINGKQRSGKSFLANQFIKYLKHNELGEAWLDERMESCFEWRDDYESVTSGIQVWFEPLFVKIKEKEVAVIVLDTQGLHGKKTGTQENSIIFGLSVLLSSVFIYNDRHNFGEDSLQFLRSYLEFAKFASGDDKAEGLVFQKLILLLRDFEAVRQFAYGYYDENSCPPNQPKNLKRYIFEETQDIHNEAIETRTGIERCFQEIGVYAMSGPGKQMPHKPECESSSAWDPEFRFCIIDFVTTFFSPESILNSSKRVLGQMQTGEQLKEYVSMWAQLIQDAEGMVESKTIFEITADLFYRKKLEVTLNEYRTLMKRHLDYNITGLAETALSHLHELVMTCIESKFCKSGALGGESLLNEYKNQLHQRINGVKYDFVQVNDTKVAAEQERILKEEGRIADQELEELKKRERLEKEVETELQELKFQKRMLELEKETQRKETILQRQQEEARNLAVSTAETHYHQRLQDLHVSLGKLEQVINNRESYISTVHRIIPFPSTRMSPLRFDARLYQQALQQAEAEVKSIQQQVVDANNVLKSQRKS